MGIEHAQHYAVVSRFPQAHRKADFRIISRSTILLCCLNGRSRDCRDLLHIWCIPSEWMEASSSLPIATCAVIHRSVYERMHTISVGSIREYFSNCQARGNVFQLGRQRHNLRGQGSRIEKLQSRIQDFLEGVRLFASRLVWESAPRRVSKTTAIKQKDFPSLSEKGTSYFQGDQFKFKIWNIRKEITEYSGTVFTPIGVTTVPEYSEIPQ